MDLNYFDFINLQNISLDTWSLGYRKGRKIKSLLENELIIHQIISMAMMAKL